MDNAILQDNLYWSLLRISWRAKHGLIRIAERHDLALMQMITLCSMEPEKGTPMNTISCLLNCDASNVTGIVDRLLAQGLIVREECSHDRRVKLIRPTEKGVALQAKLLDEVRAYAPESFNNLDANQKKQLLELVKLVLGEPEN
ncbi:MAG TPA: MarR family transcriptional regulator [Candidatus Saccharimonadales bacterium]|nr:MarR family transcriptional regulator [Candidatus Saccharimonadales bacterium]